MATFCNSRVLTKKKIMLEKNIADLGILHFTPPVRSVEARLQCRAYWNTVSKNRTQVAGHCNLSSENVHQVQRSVHRRRTYACHKAHAHRDSKSGYMLPQDAHLARKQICATHVLKLHWICTMCVSHVHAHSYKLQLLSTYFWARTWRGTFIKQVFRSSRTFVIVHSLCD